MRIVSSSLTPLTVYATRSTRPVRERPGAGIEHPSPSAPSPDRPVRPGPRTQWQPRRMRRRACGGSSQPCSRPTRTQFSIYGNRPHGRTGPSRRQECASTEESSACKMADCENLPHASADTNSLNASTPSDLSGFSCGSPSFSGSSTTTNGGSWFRLRLLHPCDFENGVERLLAVEHLEEL